MIELYSETDKGIHRSYRPTPKLMRHTLFSKKAQPLYLEHLKILVGRAGWKVTKQCALYVRAIKVQKRFYFDESAF